MNISDYKTVPFGVISTLEPRQQQDVYLEKFFRVPKNTKKIITSTNTGSYIRGLVKTHKLQPEQAPQIAFAVLRVAVGEIALPKLATVLSSELKLANDKAQKIATEIEKDLFAPVALELNEYLAKQKQSQGAGQTKRAQDAGASNVLNLKNTPKPPRPPQIPKPPVR